MLWTVTNTKFVLPTNAAVLLLIDCNKTNTISIPKMYYILNVVTQDHSNVAESKLARLENSKSHLNENVQSQLRKPSLSLMDKCVKTPNRELNL